MIRLILTRLATGLITLFLTAFFVFFAVQALPGDVAQQLLGQDATPESLALLRSQLGLDQNIWVRFGDWISGAVVGDFGTSLVSGAPVAPAAAPLLRVVPGTPGSGHHALGRLPDHEPEDHVVDQERPPLPGPVPARVGEAERGGHGQLVRAPDRHPEDVDGGVQDLHAGTRGEGDEGMKCRGEKGRRAPVAVERRHAPQGARRLVFAHSPDRGEVVDAIPLLEHSSPGTHHHDERYR